MYAMITSYIEHNGLSHYRLNISYRCNISDIKIFKMERAITFKYHVKQLKTEKL